MSSIWLALTNVKGLGVKGINKIYNQISHLSLEDFKDDIAVNQIKKLVNKKVAETLSDYAAIKQLVKKAEESIIYHESKGIKIVTIASNHYPELLRKIDNPPIVLYCKGNLKLLASNKTIAVVGTRNPTPLGKKMARRIASLFAEKEFIIVSGLALGIDTEGHIGALEAKGKTIAVLAGGLDSIFPKENLQLAEKIIEEDGLLMTEYPLHSPNFRAAFVQRDRIQSGLSASICPVQTDIKGGTQHTINFAKEQGRFIFCPEPMEEVPATRGIFQLFEEGVFRFKSGKDVPEVEQNINLTLKKLLYADKEQNDIQLDLFN